MSEGDKPEDAIEYIRANIGDALNDKDTIGSLHVKLTEANQLIDELRAKLSRYEEQQEQQTPMEVAAESDGGVASTETAAVVEPVAAAEMTEPMQVEPAPKEAAEVAADVPASPIPVVAVAETTPTPSPAPVEAAAEVPPSTGSQEVAETPAAATTTTPSTTTAAAAVTTEEKTEVEEKEKETQKPEKEGESAPAEAAKEEEKKTESAKE